METALFVLVIVCACGFTMLNGFRDAANSIAGAVRTGALKPRIAVVGASVFACLGTLLSTSFSAALLDAASFEYHSPGSGLGLLLAAIVAATGWLLWAWMRGIPHSSTHALFAGLAGALLASALLHPEEPMGVPLLLLGGVLIPTIVTPLVAFLVSFVATIPATWFMRHSTSSRVTRVSRGAQAVTSLAVSLGNGLQDGQRNAALLTFAFVIYSGTTTDAAIPWWAPVVAALCMGLGALGGAWRITHTIAYRLVRFDPLRGATAQGVSALLLFAGAMILHLPLSTTQAVTSSIVGAGANQRFESVMWTNVLRVASYWLTGPIICLGLGWVLFLALHPLVG
ncbi:inorganic phosphate transporter [Zhihengliuella salsuginis]|uniref:Low-affinity inorganic phosphate transporter n=1 Tax=Zhihengliuella salsuginis TaxID=578222 RepID=A0ABQ3GMR8_9MICC|nr:inorganic phosphate transporter [Zhihengliuella salsuginis]GHD13128.1 putative low-affinity inorganic phosphate transporter [Zhihengliuella salsuginis]